MQTANYFVFKVISVEEVSSVMFSPCVISYVYDGLRSLQYRCFGLFWVVYAFFHAFDLCLNLITFIIKCSNTV